MRTWAFPAVQSDLPNRVLEIDGNGPTHHLIENLPGSLAEFREQHSRF